MPKSVPTFTILSYGRYTAWDRSSRQLPKIIKHTLDIPLELGVEFGFILSVKRGKGEVLEYVIEHPPFCDEDGVPMPSFEGSYFVNSNDFQFFLGDTVWEPLADKAGLWTLIVRYKGREVARKSFCIKNGTDLSENR